MAYKSIKNWPEAERPRERLLKYGAKNLSDAQLLAIILRTGGGGKSAIDLAIEILNSLGDLKSIENASLAEFSSFKSVGKAKIAQVKAALELGKRLIEEPIERGPAFSSGHDVYLYYSRHFKNLKKKVLDHVIIGDEKYTSMMEKGYIKN